MGFTYVILGAGRTGLAAATDLQAFGDADQVRIYDRDPALARRASERAPGVIAATFDASEADSVRGAVQGADAVLSCVPYWFNAELARAAVEAGAHFNDLGGNTRIVQQELALHEQARARGVSVVPDCGLAPGLVNTLAAAGIGRLQTCERAELRCGGLPQHPQGPLDYQLSFSISGLTNEYTGKGIALRDGELVRVPTLTEVEHLDWPGVGELEAFVTSGGTSTAPWSFQGKVQSYDYKTMRYPGHVDKLRLLDQLGLFSLEPVKVEGQHVVPRRLLEAVAGPRLQFGDPHDMILTRVRCTGTFPDGTAGSVVFELEDRYDPASGLAAMERCTAFPAATVTQLQAQGRVPAGAQPLEVCVDPEAFLVELRRRDLRITDRVER